MDIRKRHRAKRSRPNPRLVKIHRSYTIEDAASVCGVHKNTFTAWFKAGLARIDDVRPYLIHGATLREFLETRRGSKKQPCRPGELYCLRCRAPKAPAGNRAEYQPLSSTLGSLAAVCPDCGAAMNRRVNVKQLEQIPAEIDVTRSPAQSHLIESDELSLNRDFPIGDCNHV